MTVQAVLWDADGVLQRVPNGGEESMRPAVEDRGIDVDAFLAEAVAAERRALTGELRWLDILPGLLRRWGLEAAYDDVVAVWLDIEPVAVARDLARTVRAAGVGCYLASNQDEHRARHMHQHLGYPDLLDGELYSCDLGLAKPDPAYFQRVLNRLRLQAAQVLLIDDNEDNVGAARSVGLLAEVWSYLEPVEVLTGHLAHHGALT